MNNPVLNARGAGDSVEITLDGEPIIHGKDKCLRFAKRLRDVAQAAGAAAVQARWAAIVTTLEAA